MEGEEKGSPAREGKQKCNGRLAVGMGWVVEVFPRETRVPHLDASHGPDETDPEQSIAGSEH